MTIIQTALVLISSVLLFNTGDMIMMAGPTEEHSQRNPAAGLHTGGGDAARTVRGCRTGLELGWVVLGWSGLVISVFCC